MGLAVEFVILYFALALKWSRASFIHSPQMKLTWIRAYTRNWLLAWQHSNTREQLGSGASSIPVEIIVICVLTTISTRDYSLKLDWIWIAYLMFRPPSISSGPQTLLWPWLIHRAPLWSSLSAWYQVVRQPPLHTALSKIVPNYVMLNWDPVLR